VVAAQRVQLRGRPLLGRPLPRRRKRLLRLVPALLRPPPLSESTSPSLPASSWSAAATLVRSSSLLPHLYLDSIYLSDLAVMSEDMVKDGYIDIMNIDISSVVTEMMRKKYTHIPQLRCILFLVIHIRYSIHANGCKGHDKGTKLSFYCYVISRTLDSLMCGVDATLSASRMLEEVNRLLRPGGIYMLITYGDPSVRIPRLNQPGCSWNIILYIIRQDSKAMEGVVRKGRSWNLSHLPNVVSYHQVLFLKIQTHYIYVCEKEHGL
ncbi:unnamed protein product, partial [Musa banksii]